MLSVINLTKSEAKKKETAAQTAISAMMEQLGTAREAVEKKSTELTSSPVGSMLETIEKARNNAAEKLPPVDDASPAPISSPLRPFPLGGGGRALPGSPQIFSVQRMLGELSDAGGACSRRTKMTKRRRRLDGERTPHQCLLLLLLLFLARSLVVEYGVHATKGCFRILSFILITY